jgi:glycosyltransferase involved in cell wall biosynthesis
MAERRVLFVGIVDWAVLLHWSDLLRDIARRGHRVHVLCGDSGRLDEIREFGVTVDPIPISRSGTRLFDELRSIIRIARGIREFRPDLVHAVTIKPNLYAALATRVLTRRVRVVCAVTGFGYVFEAGNHSGLSMAVRWLLRVVLRSGRVHVQVENPGAVKRVIELGIATRARTHLIEGAGVDVDRFRPVEPPRAPGRPVTVLLPARVLRDKGVVEFIEAARLLAMRPDLRFLLAGRLDTDGNPTALSAQELEELLTGSEVRWLGEVDSIENLMRGVDIVALPSYHEGLPKALLEAAACGLPLVATDIPGCRPVVRDGENGILVPVRDAPALAMAIERLAADSELRSTYGRRSRQMALDRFDRRIILERFAELHDGVLRR